MSNVNIKRAVENIRANTTIYTPVVEMIVNAVQAIDETEKTDGKVSIRVRRESQAEVDGSLPDVNSFEIEDNGIGFNDAHRDSFDTLYTDLKIVEGGKGFGRFTCLKYSTTSMSRASTGALTVSSPDGFRWARTTKSLLTKTLQSARSGRRAPS
jgi:hypothetical protein